jgi:5-methylthioadenosine/S-adenosylhomocysteine deaminase
MRASPRHSGRRLAPTLFAWLLAAACGDQSEPAPSAPVVPADLAAEASAVSTPIVLRGAVVTPEGALKQGYVGIMGGRIQSVSSRQPDIPGADVIRTDGIVIPGFVDLHNHVAWNVLPRWHPRRRYANRYQWQVDPDYQQAAGTPFDHLAASHFCAMNAWGELRALVGGTTSILATQPVPCIHGLVRNLDFNSGFYGSTELDREHIVAVLGIPLPDDPAGRAEFVDAARFLIANPAYEALAVHVAEGTDASSKEEFTFLQSQSLLNPKGLLIHGIPLVPADFRAMASAGTALVWSPRSNLALYGATADVGAALDAGVEVALAPDWAVTGSGTMLDELKTAAAWDRQQLQGRLTPRQLLDMVTSVPARAAGIDDEAGTLRAGLRADLVVLRGDATDPYGSVLRAGPREVQLVMIDGVPLYGDASLMRKFWASADLERIEVSNAAKAVATPAAGVTVAGLVSELGPALEAEGTSLAPLGEADPAEPE